MVRHPYSTWWPNNSSITYDLLQYVTNLLAELFGASYIQQNSQRADQLTHSSFSLTNILKSSVFNKITSGKRMEILYL